MRRTLMVLGLALGVAASAAAQSFTNFESGHVRPLALSPDGSRLFAVNTPDNRLEIYTVGAGTLTLAAEVQVGLEPVAVAARTNTEVWVVNHLSDSVSVVQMDGVNPDHWRVVQTLLTCDEPRDIVFAGAGGTRAFVTTARRGQNCPIAANLTTAGTGRAIVQVWNAAALGAALGGTPIANIVLFSDTPRALAKSPDGSIVYAAAFHSGNRTTSILETTVTNSGNTRPPLPPGSVSGAPNTGLIVKFNGTSNRWEDERGASGPDWTPQVPFSLPDRDVFLIDALAGTPQLFSSANNVTGVGTVIFNMAVRPDNGHVFVANTDARNNVRFEPFISPTQGVQGHIAESRITVINGTTPTPHHLNPLIDYTCVPPSCPQDAGEVESSLAFPMDMVFSSDGQRVYVVGFGSEKVGVFDTDDLESNIITKTLIDVGAGPSGIVLDSGNNQLFVMNRIDHTISVVANANTPASAAQVATIPLRYDPSPDDAKVGRIFLYDARRTSAHGDQACASCHIFGDFDSLAWDLGNPFGTSVPNPNPFVVGSGGPFHPLKGPMTTQSLRGMAGAGPMHWRGDRTGGTDPGGDPLDEDAAFKKFDPAFVSLLGRPTQLDASSMQAFTNFILTVQYPPNPIRALNNLGTTPQNSGETFFTSTAVDAGFLDCDTCHALPLGTAGLSSIEGETQEFKVAHLRNIYQKIGMFGVSGDQVRGFGYLHDGSVFTVFDFLHAAVFSFPNDTTRRNVEAFIHGFDTGLKPIVGQQVSAAPLTVNDTNVIARIQLLIDRANAGDCDLTVKGRLGGLARGWLFVGSDNFQPDRNADGLVDKTTLRNQAGTSGQELTYTCVPPGSGTRIAIDRDEDGVFDRRELDCGSDPADPGSTATTSGACSVVTTSTTTTTTVTTTSGTGSTTTTTGAASTTTTTTVAGSTTTTTLPTATVNIQATAVKMHDKTTPPNPRARRFVFWSNTRRESLANEVVVPAVGSAGDPTVAGATGGGADLTVYNSHGSGEKVLVHLPATGWTAVGTKGYRYKGLTTNDAVSRVTVKADLIRVRAGHSAWAYTLDEASQGSVAVRLRLGSGAIWCANAPAKAGAQNDTVDKFIGGPGSVPPAVCPPVP
jgi:DNA-binding beta-propeller fold protein YncE